MDNQDRLLATLADASGGYAHARLPEPTFRPVPNRQRRSRQAGLLAQ
jgi:hypothetical protein